MKRALEVLFVLALLLAAGAGGVMIAAIGGGCFSYAPTCW